MKLLIVSPDYASHAGPLIEIGRAWSRDHGEVTMATGHAVRPSVVDAGLGWTGLRLGKGSNPGVIEENQQPEGEDAHLRAFFDATREGPVATLRYQADARRHDLMHDPDGVFDRLRIVLDEERPDRVVVDHVAFGARLALHALGVECATVVLGHPSALPSGDEVYGLPDDWPALMRPAPDELADLDRRCHEAVAELTTASDEFLARRAPGAPPAGDLTRAAGSPTIYVYPSALHPVERSLAPGSAFVGSLARHQNLGPFPLPGGNGLRVTVALGSFLSARGDVLRAAVTAARLAGWRLSIAHGSTPRAALGELPVGAVAVRHLPQVALLRETDVFINHGGNGSVTESVAAYVPMVVLPFSTDQFAGAAAIERAGIGVALAPNGVTPESLVDAVAHAARRETQQRLLRVSEACAADGGAARAARIIAGGR